MKIVSITRKLQGLVAVSTVLIIAFGVMAYISRASVQIGGVAYTNIVRNKDLTADILPPPAYTFSAWKKSIIG